ncbi:YolD-like protein [Scopulibacillus darangshiensis]|uniref:YolD-like protein n=1 Tax=Scopulibacillus darangshiensis TaxID=442528 RepID=A0A4R2NRF9_9BACL|nr:YolD-like family protein [Scopulibacillus darangshiensis]TCP24503.1 YolD-like protein [Scopulibacillus darangshiensis]
MVKDRGTIKWTSLMLPEHMTALRQWKADYKKIEKPILDEQEYEEIDRVLCDAMGEALPVIVDYYKNGFIEQLVGFAQRYDQLNKVLYVQNKNRDLVKLKFELITNVGISEEDIYPMVDDF